jgi:branched-chain amino acid transport system permease protein
MTEPQPDRRAIERLLARRRLHWAEALPWLLALLVYALLPQYLPLGTQVLIMVLFALSLDLVLGYAGVVILGHAAFYGLGAYTAGLLAVNGWKEPLSGLAAAAAMAALFGMVTGAVILRTTALALLMLGMAVALILAELANRLAGLTGGFDGLQGITIDPVLGRFEFDFFGQIPYLYSLTVLFLCWILVRQVVNAPFGRSLVGIRENPGRMEAIGTPVRRRKLIAFTLSAGLAGLAGGLSAQTNQFVAPSVFGFDLSGTVLVMLVLGGPGRLYGAFIGAPLYMIAQDLLAKGDPVYWSFWLGLILIGVVLFVRGGVLGIADRLRALAARVLANLGLGRHAGG